MLLDEAQTDWLASRPVFYNERTGAISHNMNEVIDYDHLEIDPEGLNNYLDFGYTVFGQTMVRHVKTLRYARSIRRENGQLVITEQDDPAERLYGRTELSGRDVMDKIIDRTRSWARQTDGDIILPLSGGNDSKILAYSVRDNAAVHAFTYGYSRRQEKSHEVVKASKVARACH